MPIVKHNGGNIMVWGPFSRDSIGLLHRMHNGSGCILRYNQEYYVATWNGQNASCLEGRFSIKFENLPSVTSYLFFELIILCSHIRETIV